MVQAFEVTSQIVGVYSANPAVDETVRWLLELGLPPLPVAPYHDPAMGVAYQIKGTEKLDLPLPKFNGKNPSFLTSSGVPIAIRHLLYQARMPNEEVIKAWFKHPRTGVATMGGWRNIVWVDVDAKRFGSVEDCQRATEAWIERYGLHDTYIERTHRGGYHIALRVAELAETNFTAFRFDPAVLKAANVKPLGQDGWVGEVIKTGVPIVLAPTRGEAGRYRVLNRTMPMRVESLDQLGLLPRQASIDSEQGSDHKPDHKLDHKLDQSQVSAGQNPMAAQETIEGWEPIVTGRTVFLHKLLCQEVRELMRSCHSAQTGERSDILVRIAREALGWQHWMRLQGFGSPYPDADTFVFRIGQIMQLEQERIQRILDSKSQGGPIRNSMPSLWYHRSDSGCLRKLRQAV